MWKSYGINFCEVILVVYCDGELGWVPLSPKIRKIDYIFFSCFYTNILWNYGLELLRSTPNASQNNLFPRLAFISLSLDYLKSFTISNCKKGYIFFLFKKCIFLFSFSYTFPVCFIFEIHLALKKSNMAAMCIARDPMSVHDWQAGLRFRNPLTPDSVLFSKKWGIYAGVKNLEDMILLEIYS